MIELQHIIETKRELLSRETYSRHPINYSEGMAEDQKDRYIQYLAEQHKEDLLTQKAMQLVLEDFMARQKELDERMAAVMSEQAELKKELAEERQLRKSLERKAESFKEKLDLQTRNVSVTDGRKSGRRQVQVLLRRLSLTVAKRRTILTGLKTLSVWIRLTTTGPVLFRRMPGKKGT